MNNNSAEQFFPRSARSSSHGVAEPARRRPSRNRMPSSAGYLVGVIALSIALFFALWLLLSGGSDEAPWFPAGLGASVVLLVALSAREVVMRRAWTRYLLEQGIQEKAGRDSKEKGSSGKRIYSTSLLSAALRNIQKQAAEADAAGSSPDAHLDVFHLCRDYASSTEEALKATGLPAEKRIALRAGQERARILQKHHLLTWARESSRALSYEAQRRARTSDKIETANRAIQSLESALRIYPDEPELDASKRALREFIASVKVAHWVELAERSAFKGHHRRAIERYKDALFYLNRETENEDLRSAGANRIAHEIEALQAQMKSSHKGRREVGNERGKGGEEL